MMTATSWEMTTEYVTIIQDRRWVPNPKLKSMLEDGWEPFAVFEPETNIGGSRGPSSPLVWLKRPKFIGLLKERPDPGIPEKSGTPSPPPGPQNPSVPPEHVPYG